MRARLLVILCFLVTLVFARGGTLLTFRTGVDERTGALLANGQADTDWNITSITPTGNDGTAPRAAIVSTTMGNDWPIASLPIPGTEIITRGNSTAGVDNTLYRYTYTFNLSTLNQHGLSISGQVWADNMVTIRLNDNAILTMTDLDTYRSGPISFSSSMSSYFINGLNLLTFDVANRTTNTGLDVSGIITSTPEAGEWAMLMGGLFIPIFLYRNKFRAALFSSKTALVS